MTSDRWWRAVLLLAPTAAAIALLVSAGSLIRPAPGTVDEAVMFGRDCGTVFEPESLDEPCTLARTGAAARNIGVAALAGFMAALVVVWFVRDHPPTEDRMPRPTVVRMVLPVAVGLLTFALGAAATGAWALVASPVEDERTIGLAAVIGAVLLAAFVLRPVVVVDLDHVQVRFLRSVSRPRHEIDHVVVQRNRKGQIASQILVGPSERERGREPVVVPGLIDHREVAAALGTDVLDLPAPEKLARPMRTALGR